MAVCEHCQYRNSWDCQDDYYKSKNGCESFRLDFDTLTKKQQKAIRRILAHEEELLGEQYEQRKSERD